MGSITKGITKAVGGIPIIGGMAKSVDTLVRRPGDFAKNPMELVNLAATLSGMGVIPPIPIGGTLGKVLFNPATPLEKIGNVLLNNASGGSLPLLTGQGGLGMAAQGKEGNPFQAALEQAFISSLMGNGGLTGLMKKPSDEGYFGAAGGAFKGLGDLGQGLAQMGYGAMGPLLAQMARVTGANDADPYGLAPAQQQKLNTGLDATNAGMEAAIQRLRQNLASRGLHNPGLRAAAEERIRSAYGGQRRQQLNQAQNEAFNTRLSGLQALLGQYGGLGAQGAGMVGQAGGGFQNIGQSYVNRDLGWQGSMGSLFGLLMAQRNQLPQFPQLNPQNGGFIGSMTPQGQQGIGGVNTFGLNPGLFKPAVKPTLGGSGSGFMSGFSWAPYVPTQPVEFKR